MKRSIEGDVIIGNVSEYYGKILSVTGDLKTNGGYFYSIR